MLGIPKHEEAPPTPPHPLSPMGDACSRMDLTAIHQILVATHYKDDEGTNEVIHLKLNMQKRYSFFFFYPCDSYAKVMVLFFSYLSKSGLNK